MLIVIVKVIFSLAIFEICSYFFIIKYANKFSRFSILVNTIFVALILYQIFILKIKEGERFELCLAMELGILITTIEDVCYISKFKPILDTFRKNNLFVLFFKDNKLNSKQICVVADELNKLYYVNENYIIFYNFTTVHFKRNKNNIYLVCNFGFFNENDLEIFLQSKIIDNIGEIHYNKKNGGTFEVIQAVE